MTQCKIFCRIEHCNFELLRFLASNREASIDVECTEPNNPQNLNDFFLTRSVLLNLEPCIFYTDIIDFDKKVIANGESLFVIYVLYITVPFKNLFPPYFTSASFFSPYNIEIRNTY